MIFLSESADLDCGSLRTDPENNVDDLVQRAADCLHGGGVAAFRLGRLRLGGEDSRRLALLIVDRLRERLIDLGAPRAMRVENDRVQTTDIPSGAAVRDRLPHFDGQHCSYLTPSTEDDPDWDTALRTFSLSGYTTTAAHKLYQGIFITDPGHALSVTTYYDWLSVIADVRAARHLDAADNLDPSAAARWLGANLRRSLAAQPSHDCSYPSLGAMLGLTEEAFHAMGFANADDHLSAEVAARYPILWPMARQCPCGTCVGDTGRVFCHMLVQSVGLSWPAFRARYEILVPSERYDLVIGHNLTMLHGGWAGAPDRLLEPLCLVVDEPSGADYERWLAASWRRTFPALLPATSRS
jgi:hypothetical protein